VINKPCRLIAIGGGGFTHDVDPAMEDFILAQSRRALARVGFIGTASGDDPHKIGRFHERFSGCCAQHTHVAANADAGTLARWLVELDLVYVGGGNTLHLLSRWRALGWDRVLIDAAHRGVLMAGVSAGASAWFAQALTDAGGAGLAPVEGIGLMTGSCCPHYSTEPARRTAFPACIASGVLPDGVAIDDGVALLIDGSGTMTAFSARRGAGAYRVLRSGAEAICEAIAPVLTP